MGVLRVCLASNALSCKFRLASPVRNAFDGEADRWAAETDIDDGSNLDNDISLEV